MAGFGPISRDELIRNMRRLGFEGPHSGTKHQFMRRGNHRTYIPNPHRGDISPDLLANIL